MSSLGIRISQEGVDVKTGLDKQMVLTSKYSIFKGSIQGTGTVSVPRNGTPTTVTIPHGLGYAPMVQAFIKEAGAVVFSSTVWQQLPIYTLYSFPEGDGEFSATISSDSTNIYIEFYMNDLVSQFGNSSLGSTNYVMGNETPALAFIDTTHIAGAGETVQSIKFYAKKRDNTESIDVGIYRVESGLPTTKIGGGTVSVNDTTMQVWTVDMGNLALTEGHEYCLAYGGWGGNQSLGEYNTTVPMDTGSGQEVSFRENTEQSLPASWDHNSYGAYIPSLWAVYTSGAIDIQYTYTVFIDKANP